MDNKLANNGNGKVTSIRAPLIKECMTLTLGTLDQHLTTMFDEVEPAYLDFAEMAETNQSQLRFVDAINLIKGQRDQIERAFEEQISRGFLEFRDGKSITYPAHISLPHPEGHLSIVDNDDLEKHVAIQKMVGRLHSESFQEIYALGQRMAMLRGGQKLREEDMPGSAIHIATCFDIATGKLQLDSKMLLILLLLFDRFVMRKCTGIYRQLNERLVRAGIFPNLRYETPEPSQDPTSAPSRERNPAGAIRREQATHGHPEPGGGSAPAPYAPGQTVSAGTTGSTLVNHPAATANGTPAAERSTVASANHPGDSHAPAWPELCPGDHRQSTGRSTDHPELAGGKAAGSRGRRQGDLLRDHLPAEGSAHGKPEIQRTPGSIRQRRPTGDGPLRSHHLNPGGDTTLPGGAAAAPYRRGRPHASHRDRYPGARTDQEQPGTGTATAVSAHRSKFDPDSQPQHH
ncbi:MAG: DUF1631 family protein [gamma proteobacterium symbiont of Phacoides pectinatus]